MGSGASAELKGKITEATPEEIAAAVKELPAESITKLKDALAKNAAANKDGCVEEFLICGQLLSKDIPMTSKAVLVDTALQMEKEPRAPRFDVMGEATGGSGLEAAKDLIFWLAEFECMEAWAGPEHKEREGNADLMKVFTETGKSTEPFPKCMMENMAGSYTGPAFHLEKPGSGDGAVYAVLVRLHAKDADAADKIEECLKLHGPVQLAAEEGALRCTMMRTKFMVGPLAKDDVTVQWVETFKTKEDFVKHLESPHHKDAVAKIQALCGDDPSKMVSTEFANSKHFKSKYKK